MTDQTDLRPISRGEYYPLSSNTPGFLTSVPGKTVYEVTSNAYTLASTDANNIVYIPGSASGGFPPINITVPTTRPILSLSGPSSTLSVNNSVGGSDIIWFKATLWPRADYLGDNQHRLLNHRKFPSDQGRRKSLDLLLTP